MNDSLAALDLPKSLLDRILCRASDYSDSIPKNNNKDKALSFVLYLPTVVLRHRHNPAFALACRLANHHNLPVIVLCTTLDDHHLSRTPVNHHAISMTARRLAFSLEALQSSCPEWERHGAGVAIRVHGPGARTPHHLTLIHQAAEVVTDEPFIEPFRMYMRKIVHACQTAKIPCWSVDGSTTVPPKSLLTLVAHKDGDVTFSGAPAKAWMWEKTTDPFRKAQVYGTVRDGHLDAPLLQNRLPANFILATTTSDTEPFQERVSKAIPTNWKNIKTPCPGQRPWTVEELVAIHTKEWVMTSWPGADTSVPPCVQTNGSLEAAKKRWKQFLQTQLKSYAKRRNLIMDPHAVSRMSCYLNMGIISIMDVVHDVWQAQSSQVGCTQGCRKFLDEVVKWREIGYVHTFASPHFPTAVQDIPKWAHAYLERQQISSAGGYGYEQLESATTQDEKWNAMQNYLIETGELHNNARMTWGKTVVHWQATKFTPEDVLWQMCCLNDRFALDGLSPPSYAGLLWCFGWCDKPGSGGSVSTKWAHRYRAGPSAFGTAKEALYNGDSSPSSSGEHTAGEPPKKKTKHEGISSKSPSSMAITSYFSSVPKNTHTSNIFD
jgi:deoxyribodipyrimidine photolyase